MKNTGPRQESQAKSKHYGSFVGGAEAGDDAQVLQSGGIALDFGTGGNLLQKPAHDLSRAGLGQGFGKPDVVGLGHGPDLARDVVSQFIPQRRVRDNAGLDGDEGNQRLALQVIGPADDSGFGDFLVTDEGTLDLRGAD